MNHVMVDGRFDDLKARHMRFLQEAARLGTVHVMLWSDQAIQRLDGQAPKFPQEEREYFVRAIRYVDSLTLSDSPDELNSLFAAHAARPAICVVEPPGDSPAKRLFCEKNQIGYQVLPEDQLQDYPEPAVADASALSSGRKRVIVTGCYDWFHSGHVRFFEEVSELGDLYVVVGHDANIKLLKGDGHPMYPEQVRRYMAGSIRYVKQAFVSSGHGWLDAEPEIERIRPDVYAVNEDGDVPEKREYCEIHGIEYRVLKRTPKEGLPTRRSTDLRGF
jgi:cytidyltransferase-like protein